MQNHLAASHVNENIFMTIIVLMMEVITRLFAQDLQNQNSTWPELMTN